MTTYWECTQCNNWERGDSTPSQCSNCTNGDFEQVPQLTNKTTALPSFDLSGFRVASATLILLNLISIPLGPLLNTELGGIGDIVALGGIVSTAIMVTLMFGVSNKSYRPWVAALFVFGINAIGVVVMAVEEFADTLVLSNVEVFGQTALVLLKNFAGMTFVTIFQSGTGQVSAIVLWAILTFLPLGMLINGRDQLIIE